MYRELLQQMRPTDAAGGGGGGGHGGHDGGFRTWVVFDGSVDAAWVESLNSVLDDSRLLCVANGERIKLNGETMRALFEVQDLRVASPATVSRCGMVWIAPEALGWRPFVQTWLAALLGEAGAGFKYLQVGFAKTRAIYGARIAGVAQGALDYALNYMQTREQFGQPLAEFQALRFRAADLAARVEAARQLSYHAVALAEDETPDASAAASMAKLFASEVCTEVTQQAIQFLGGHGMMKDHPVERYYRETKLFQIGDGSSEMLRLLVSRHLNRQSQAGMSARLASE